MEEGFTVLYVGWLLIKTCLIAVSWLFFLPSVQEQVAQHQAGGR